MVVRTGISHKLKLVTNNNCARKKGHVVHERNGGWASGKSLSEGE